MLKYVHELSNGDGQHGWGVVQQHRLLPPIPTNGTLLSRLEWCLYAYDVVVDGEYMIMSFGLCGGSARGIIRFYANVLCATCALQTGSIACSSCVL